MPVNESKMTIECCGSAYWFQLDRRQGVWSFGLRDNASPEQLVTLANLQTLNTGYIEMGMSKDERLQRLHEKAGYIMQLLTTVPAMEDLKRLG